MQRMTQAELSAIMNKALRHARTETLCNARRAAIQARIETCQSAAKVAQARLEHQKAGGGNSRTDSLIAEVAAAHCAVSDALKALEDFDAELTAVMRPDL